MPRNGEHRCGQAQGPINLTVEDERNQRGNIGGKVDDLGGTGGGFEIHAAKPCENQQQERAGAGAVDAVINADHQSGAHGDGIQGLLGAGSGVFTFAHGLVFQHIKGHDGQHHQQHPPENGLRQQHGDVGADGGADERHDRSTKGELHRYIAVFQKTPGGNKGSGAGGEFVGGDGGVGGNSGDQVGRQGDEPAAAGNGVHKAGQKYQRAYN